MVRMHRIDENIREPPRVASGRADEQQGYRWVHHRPVAMVYIDLDQDNGPDIVQQLDRWEQLETHRSLTPGASATTLSAS